MPAAPRIFFRLFSLNGLLLLSACSYDPSHYFSEREWWEKENEWRSTSDSAWVSRRLEEREELRRR